MVIAARWSKPPNLRRKHACYHSCCSHEWEFEGKFRTRASFLTSRAHCLFAPGRCEDATPHGEAQAAWHEFAPDHCFAKCVFSTPLDDPAVPFAQVPTSQRPIQTRKHRSTTVVYVVVRQPPSASFLTHILPLRYTIRGIREAVVEVGRGAIALYHGAEDEIKFERTGIQ